MQYLDDFMAFMDASVINVYAVRSVIERLEKKGFTRLDQSARWDNIRPGSRHYVVKNDTAVFAFVAGADPSAGFKIISAHSDSPGFRIKPRPEMVSDGGVTKLNVEVYGGPILYTWFDRPLSVAGRVVVRSTDPLHPTVVPVRISRPLLTIPHLAIHFNRAVNDGNPLSRQKDMLPVVGIVRDRAEADGFMLRLVAAEAGVEPADILDFDLMLYDTTPAVRFGAAGEFLSSGRLDDLGMVHAGLSALLENVDADPRGMTRVLAVFDNEETGSGTKQGAASPVLRDLLERLNTALGGSEEDFLRGISNSFMISADNAHALHPNYVDKYDPTSHPVVGGGPVIKINANCKYMTDADSAAVFKSICEEAGVPVQYFVNHSDVAGGSTLGNILTSQLDLRGVDMGVGIWAMHSVRETMAVADHGYTIRAFSRFYAC